MTPELPILGNERRLGQILLMAAYGKPCLDKIEVLEDANYWMYNSKNLKIEFCIEHLREGIRLSKFVKCPFFP